MTAIERSNSSSPRHRPSSGYRFGSTGEVARRGIARPTQDVDSNEGLRPPSEVSMPGGHVPQHEALETRNGGNTRAAEQTRCQQGLAYSWLECRHTHRWRTSRELGRAVPSGRPQRGDVELRWARGFTPSHCLCVGTVGRGKFARTDAAAGHESSARGLDCTRSPPVEHVNAVFSDSYKDCFIIPSRVQWLVKYDGDADPAAKAPARPQRSPEQSPVSAAIPVASSNSSPPHAPPLETSREAPQQTSREAAQVSEGPQPEPVPEVVADPQEEEADEEVPLLPICFQKEDESFEDVFFFAFPIGFDLSKQKPLTVKGVKPESYAEQLGVQVGWKIISIGGVDVSDMGATELLVVLAEQKKKHLG
ncbi:Uncharacterized protein SCF082_LOCUS5877 [Durusdinium trenchii]|uniref:PDZ domain-containing protein n=1 Tax=Durusdinium trenchii TaxID=1381693 RepID=A0ABP0IC96_9DINO